MLIGFKSRISPII
ncbi:hypothetical protein LINGRAHAP2_LOCUS30264 [Linum grandiflorum]